MRYEYKTQNTCSSKITFDIDENDIVSNIEFTGGCNGNLKALQKILDGMSAAEIKEKCAGIMCGRRPTLCADQLAIAVTEASKP